VSFAGSNNPAPQVFTGEISDTQCVFNVHSHNSSHDDMIKSHTMGDTAEECARTCIKRGGKYVLIDLANKKIYPLASQSLALAEKFAGQEVRIRGVYDKDANLLSVAEIKAR
jgi:hypothetical protein